VKELASGPDFFITFALLSLMFDRSLYPLAPRPATTSPLLHPCSSPPACLRFSNQSSLVLLARVLPHHDGSVHSITTGAVDLGDGAEDSGDIPPPTADRADSAPARDHPTSIQTLFSLCSTNLTLISSCTCLKSSISCFKSIHEA
jgi:hypothetical protein